MHINTYQCHVSINAQSQHTFVGGHICLSWQVKNVSLVIYTRLIAFSDQTLHCCQSAPKCARMRQSVMQYKKNVKSAKSHQQMLMMVF